MWETVASLTLKRALTVSHDRQSVARCPVQTAPSTPLDFLLHLTMVILKMFYTQFQSICMMSEWETTCCSWTEGRWRDGWITGRNVGWNILSLLLNELQQSAPRCCTLSVQLQKALFYTAHRQVARWWFLSKKTCQIRIDTPEINKWSPLVAQ